MIMLEGESMPQAELLQGLVFPSHLPSALFHLAPLPGGGKGTKCAERVCEFTQAALGTLHHHPGAAEWRMGCCGRGAQEIHRHKGLRKL